jgi:predicted nucleic acid-binding protein
MRTTLHIDENLLKQAAKLTGVKEKTSLVRLGLMALIARVLCHPLVIGELACGNLLNRQEILKLLGSLPPATVAEHDEVMHLLESRQLNGRRLGWIDIHLLASALITGCGFWTLDRRLLRAASSLSIRAH